MDTALRRRAAPVAVATGAVPARPEGLLLLLLLVLLLVLLLLLAHGRLPSVSGGQSTTVTLEDQAVPPLREPLGPGKGLFAPLRAG
jgi:hypothetical protein